MGEHPAVKNRKRKIKSLNDSESDQLEMTVSPQIDPSLLKKKNRDDDDDEDQENNDKLKDVDFLKKFDEKQVKPIWSMLQELSTRLKINKECLKQEELLEDDEDDPE